MSKLRGILTVIAVLAILHLLALGALVGFLFHSGTLNSERVELLAGVLRGEHDPPAQDGAASVEDADEAGSAQATLAQQQMEEEMTRRRLEREKAELTQRLELVMREMNRVQQEREYFEERRRREAQSAKKKGEQSYREGFEKQMDLFEKMKPKVALEYLLSRDAEEAAELLRAMDTRKGKKIIEAAKDPNQRKKIDEILKLLPELGVEGGDAVRTK